MNVLKLNSQINPIKLLLVIILFLSLGLFPRDTSFFYFAPALILLSIISLNKYALRNKYLILAFLISAIIPIPSIYAGIDIARDTIFLLYFFSAIILGHSLARYMPIEYLIYALFFSGAYVTFLITIKLIIGFQGDLSLIAIREITSGAGAYGVVFLALCYYGSRNLILFISLIWSLILMILTQSRTMFISSLIWIYFVISNKSGFILNLIMRLSLILILILFFLISLSADSESYTFAGKMMRSFQEIIPNENQNMHANWRAVESAVALNAFLNGSFFEIVFGKGLGYRLSLGFDMTLANIDFDSIPILHNGYLYILLKYGVFGLVLWYKFLSSLVIREGNQVMITISKSCFYIILVTQLVSGGVMQYQGLLFLLIMAACSTLNSKNAKIFS
jgi:hypothetical protein